MCYVVQLRGVFFSAFGLVLTLLVASYPLIMIWCTYFCFHLVIMPRGPESKFERVDWFVRMRNCMIINMDNHSYACMSGIVIGCDKRPTDGEHVTNEQISDLRQQMGPSLCQQTSEETVLVPGEFALHYCQNGSFHHLL